MGKALRNLESYYLNIEKKHRKHLKIHVNYIENNRTYNNNDDYDIYVLINKINALKKYLENNTEIEAANMENNHENVEKLLTIPEAAEYCGLRSDKTIRNWIKQGMPFSEVPGKTNPRKVVRVSDLDVWKHGKPENPEFVNMENIEPVDNSVSAKNTHTEIIEPEKYYPIEEKKYVTQDELNSYTEAVKNFTEALNEMKQENKVALEQAISQQLESFMDMFEELKKEKDREFMESQAALKNLMDKMNEERLAERIKELDNKIAAVQERQQRKWWKKLFK